MLAEGGQLDDPASFVKRLNEVMLTLAGGKLADLDAWQLTRTLKRALYAIRRLCENPLLIGQNLLLIAFDPSLIGEDLLLVRHDGLLVGQDLFADWRGSRRPLALSSRANVS